MDSSANAVNTILIPRESVSRPLLAQLDKGNADASDCSSIGRVASHFDAVKSSESLENRCAGLSYHINHRSQ